MFSKFKDFLGTLTGNDDAARAGEANELQTCVAALMYHVIQADGVLRDVEIERFNDVLKVHYQLDSTKLKQLVRAAKEADSEAVDLYRFTSVIMRECSEEQRLELIELLWEMVYADGYRHEMEDNVVWRISELLGVSGRDRVILRQRVQQRLDLAKPIQGTETD